MDPLAPQVEGAGGEDVDTDGWVVDGGPMGAPGNCQVNFGRNLVSEILERERRIDTDNPSRATLANSNKIEIGNHLSVREAEDYAGEFDQNALVPHSVQIPPVDASLRNIPGPKNAARTPGGILQYVTHFHRG